MRHTTFGLMISGIAALALNHVEAKTPSQLFSDNQDAVVYLSIRQISDGSEVSHGTGFLVTRDGYIVTVAHLEVSSEQYLDAVIGGKEGVHHNLGSKPVETDEKQDVAVWRIQQSSPCRPIISTDNTPPNVTDRVLVIGFPGRLGLTPNSSSIQNLYGPDQEYVLDGSLDRGDSGAPVINEDGQVIAVFRGAHPASGTQNQAVPIAAVNGLLSKHGAALSVKSSPAFPVECYAKCASPANGVETWGKQDPIADRDSGWVGGGHGEDEECAGIQAAWGQLNPNHLFIVTKKWEESRKDILGTVTYRYHCAGLDVSEPVYRSIRGPECGLWSRTGD